MREIKTVKAYSSDSIYRKGEKNVFLGEFTTKEEIIEYEPCLSLFIENNDARFNLKLSCGIWLSEPYFTSGEMKFLEKTYDLPLINEEEQYLSFKYINSLYSETAIISLNEFNGKEYLIIWDQRWQHSFQPRGAGEDQLIADVTYIYGIWEDPLLTDEIVEKIKKGR